MRTSYLVCYDICDDKRLRRVFKTMRGYGDHLQYSVFECQLTATELVRLRAELSEIIHHTLERSVVCEPRLSRGAWRPRHHRAG